MPERLVSREIIKSIAKRNFSVNLIVDGFMSPRSSFFCYAVREVRQIAADALYPMNRAGAWFRRLR